MDRLKHPTKNFMKNEQEINKAVRMMKDDRSDLYIKEQILTASKKRISDSMLDRILKAARQQIITSQFNKANEIIPIHVARYDAMIKKLMAVEELEMTPEDWANDSLEGMAKRFAYWESVKKKKKAYMDAVDTMVQKETLLQFHSSDFVIDINSEETVEERVVKPKFDVNKLTFEEQVELMNLFKKCRKDDEVVEGIVDTRASTIETSDLSSQDTEQLNVELIGHEELYTLNESKSPIKDPTSKLREAAQKAALRKIKEAGGNLTDEEQKLIE